MVIDRALEIVWSSGLGVSLDHVNFEALIRDVAAPRTSVYRIWPTKEDFLKDLLIELINPSDPNAGSLDRSTLDSAREAVAEMTSASGDPQAAIQEVVRTHVGRSFQNMIEDRSWQTYVAIAMSLDLFPDDHRAEIEQSLRAMQERFLDTMSEYYQGMFSAAGVTLRGDLTTRQLALMASTLLEGLIQRRLITPSLVDQPIHLPGPDGQERTWSLAALGFMGLLTQFTDNVRPAGQHETAQDGA